MDSLNRLHKDYWDNSAYCKFVLLITIVGNCFFFGYQYTCLNPLVPVLDAMYNQTYFERYGEPIPSSQRDLLRSLTFSMLLAGAFLGSLTVTPALRLLTRKQAMVGMHIMIVIGTLTITLGAASTGSYEAFIVGRFVIGHALGWGVTLLSIVIGEISVFHRQSFFITIVGIGYALSDFSGPCIAHPKVLGTAELWPIMISLTMIPSLLYLCCAFWFPETPYQTLRMYGQERTKPLLKRLRTVDDEKYFDDCLNAEIRKIEYEQSGICEFEMDEVSKVKEIDVHSTKPYVGLREILATKQYRFAGGPNITVWSLGVAITTEPTRSVILQCGGAVMWFSGWLVGFLPPYLNAAMGPYGLLVWLGFSILFMIYCALFIPNTKGKTSEEIQWEFK